MPSILEAAIEESVAIATKRPLLYSILDQLADDGKVPSIQFVPSLL